MCLDDQWALNTGMRLGLCEDNTAVAQFPVTTAGFCAQAAQAER